MNTTVQIGYLTDGSDIIWIDLISVIGAVSAQIWDHIIHPVIVQHLLVQGRKGMHTTRAMEREKTIIKGNV